MHMLIFRPLFAVLIIVATTTPLVSLAYSVTDYNPQYTPYNLEVALDAKLCKDEVKAFDSDYDALSKSYTENLTQVILISGVEGSLNNVTAWLEASEFYYSNMFRECIAEDIEKEEEEDRKRASERFEQEQQAKLQKAIDECDLDYLESLSEKKRMATYDERIACKEKLDTETSTAVQQATPIAPITVPTSVPYTPPIQTYSQSSYATETSEEDKTVEVEFEATSTPTTTETKVELTEEELNKLVEERVEEALKKEEPAPEPEKPSFFKRIVNFFKGWF